MAKIERQQHRDFSGGVQAKTVQALMLSNQVPHALNAEFESKIGSITGRKGSIKKSTVVADQRVLNLFLYRKTDGTKKYLAVSDDGAGTPKVDVYVSAADGFAGAWTKTLEDWTTMTDIFFENFVNKVFAFNGVDAVKAWDGSSWTAVTNAPATGKFPVVFNQRLYVVSESGYLHYSDVVNAAGDGFTTTSWLNRGINPNDGQKVKMAVRHRGRIVILKEKSIYRFDGSNEPEATIQIGTYSGKSVVILGDLFFHNPKGIYKMGAGEPQLISRAVEKYLEGMSAANWQYVAAGRDLENVYFWIGDVTINDPHEFDYGTTYTDVVLVFNVFSQTWKVYSGWNARVWCYDETDGNTYFGTAAGKIFKINEGYADVDGTTITPIAFEVIFQPEDFGYPEKYKEVGQVCLIGEYNSNVEMGDSYDSLEDKTQIMEKEGMMNEKMTLKELWVAVRESYVDKPPRITQLIMDGINVLDDEK